MDASRTARTIAAGWQAVIAAGVEAGATPVLQVDGTTHFAHSATAIFALQRTLEQRTDPALPVLIAGSATGNWPATLLGPRVGHTQPDALSPNVYYGGEDPATYMACLVTWVDGLALSPYAAYPKFQHLFDPYFLPRRHPGIALRWETLPFALPVEAVDTQPDRTSPPVFPPSTDREATDWEATDWEATDREAGWLAGIVLSLALLLPLLAVLF